MSTTEWAQNVTIAKGKHFVKAGISRQAPVWDYPYSYSKTSWPWLEFYDGDQSIGYTGLGAADFMLGMAYLGIVFPKSAPIEQTHPSYGLSVQDDWKVTPYLTLNLGLRYDLFEQPRSKDDVFASFSPTLGKIVTAGSSLPTATAPAVLLNAYQSYLVPASQTGLPVHTMAYGDHKDFGPRVGFAWRPFRNNKTVVRGGYGIAYLDQFGNITQQGTNALPFGGLIFQYNTSPPSLPAENFFNGAAGTFPQPSAYYRDPHIREGYVQQTSLGIQHELPWGMTGEVNWQDQHNIRGENSWNMNQPYIGSGSIASRTPYPNFTTVSITTNEDTSRYDALETILRKTSAHYTFQLAYTWAKDMQEQWLDQYNRRQFWGPGYFYRPQQFKFHFVMDLPVGKGMRWLNRGGVGDAVLGGWTVSGISAPYSSGAPLTVTYSGDNAKISVTPVRPDRVCSGRLSHPTMQEWFDTSCFVKPAAGTVGNSGSGVVTGPHAFSGDAAVYKNFRLHEGVKLQFRTEAFNVFNHPTWASPRLTVNASKFGQIITKSQTSRVVQFALRLDF